MAPVVKRSERRRGGAPERRSIDGTPVRVATRRRRVQGDGVIKSASIARLHATFRACLAPLARRCRALARPTLGLPEGMVLVGTVYNCCTPHTRVSHTHQPTPARAAGSTDHGGTMHARLSLHVPLPRWLPPTQRGHPSRALQRLSKRWGA